MAYGLPTRGQLDWDDELNNSIEHTKSLAEQALSLAQGTASSVAGMELTPGPKGDKGDRGDKGERGETGSGGAAGAAGPQGDAGPRGPEGAQGPTGPKGDTGATGPKGDQGLKGDTGAAGPTGPKGDTGSTGPKGDQGDQGPKGDTGATGPSGGPIPADEGQPDGWIPSKLGSGAVWQDPANLSGYASPDDVDAAVEAHRADSTDIHGIADTAQLETVTGSQTKAAAAEAAAKGYTDTHSADTTSVHGIADTAQLETLSGSQAKVDAHSSDTTGVHGISDTALLETTSGSQAKVDAHSADTTSIHGIADTAALETQTGAQTKATTALNSAKSYTDTQVATRETPAGAQAKVDALAATKSQPNGIAVLDANGVVPTAQMPPLAINETNTVASQAAMLALTAQRGDMAIRSDNGRTYVLSVEPASTLGNWKEIMAAGQVQSVAGKTGVVSLVKGDVGLGSVDNTSDAAKPVSTAQQAALNLKAPLNSPAFTGTPTGITKAHVGLDSVDNTSDLAKPVSTATQTALDGKVNTADTRRVLTVAAGTAVPGGTPDGTLFVEYTP